MVFRKGRYFFTPRTDSNSSPALGLFTEVKFCKLNPSLCTEPKSLCQQAGSKASLVLGFRAEFAHHWPEGFLATRPLTPDLELNVECPSHFHFNVSSEMKGQQHLSDALSVRIIHVKVQTEGSIS